MVVLSFDETVTFLDVGCDRMCGPDREGGSQDHGSTSEGLAFDQCGDHTMQCREIRRFREGQIMNTDREHHPFDITQIGFRRLAPSHGPEPLANVTLEERSKSWFLERSGTGGRGRGYGPGRGPLRPR